MLLQGEKYSEIEVKPSMFFRDEFTFVKNDEVIGSVSAIYIKHCRATYFRYKDSGLADIGTSHIPGELSAVSREYLTKWFLYFDMRCADDTI